MFSSIFNVGLPEICTLLNALFLVLYTTGQIQGHKYTNPLQLTVPHYFRYISYIVNLPP